MNNTRIIRQYNFIIFLVLIVQQANAQNYTFTGTVSSADGPVVGASVYLHETHQGTASGPDGSFMLSGVKKGQYTVYVSSVGHKSVVRRVSIPLDEALVFLLEESTQNLDEVVVESDVFRQTQQESSVMIEKVTAREILKNSGTTLMNSLERLPGISSINMGVGVSKPVIRGMSFNRVVVNDSGIKQEGQQWGSEHGLEIDQFNVENIEITRGPTSLAYGSDALGGVLNIRHPVMKQDGNHAGAASLFFRSNSNTTGITASGTGNHKGLVYKFRLTGMDYGDYKVPAEEFQYNRFVLPIYDEALKNTAGRERHISTLVGLQKNWGFSHLTVSNYNQEVGIFSGAMGIPRAYQLTPDGDSRNIDLPSQDVNHFRVVSNNSIKLGKHWLEVDAAYQKNVRKEFSHPHAHGSADTHHGTLALQLDLHTVTANARFYTTRNKHQHVMGFQSSLQQNVAKGYEFLVPDYLAYQVGFFLLHQRHIRDNITVNGGVRMDLGYIQSDRVSSPFYYENNFIDTIERSPDVNRDFLNYSAGVGISYRVNEQHTIKINFGKTFRIPAPPELTANGMHHGTFRYEVGDSRLDPEEGFQFDAAWMFTRKDLQITLSPFYNYFINYIYLSPSGTFPTVEIDDKLYPVAEAGQMYHFRQTSAIHTGGEFQIIWQAHEAISFDANAEYVWIKNTATQLPLPFTPPANVQASIELHRHSVSFLKKPFLNFHVGYYWAQNRVERNEPATDGYHVLNFSSGFSLGKEHEWMNLNFNIQNILNQQYLNHLSRYRILNLPEPARSFMITISFKVERIS